MEIGSIKQKAGRSLVSFVFACIIITTGLLYVMQKAEATGKAISFSVRGVELED